MYGWTPAINSLLVNRSDLVFTISFKASECCSKLEPYYRRSSHIFPQSSRQFSVFIFAQHAIWVGFVILVDMVLRSIFFALLGFIICTAIWFGYMTRHYQANSPQTQRFFLLIALFYELNAFISFDFFSCILKSLVCVACLTISLDGLTSPSSWSLPYGNPVIVFLSQVIVVENLCVGPLNSICI